MAAGLLAVAMTMGPVAGAEDACRSLDEPVTVGQEGAAVPSAGRPVAARVVYLDPQTGRPAPPPEREGLAAESLRPARQVAAGAVYEEPLAGGGYKLVAPRRSFATGLVARRDGVGGVVLEHRPLARVVAVPCAATPAEISGAGAARIDERLAERIDEVRP
jgi:hypothetical protein